MPLVLIVAGLLAYHNSFTGPFIFDDMPSIPENPTIRHLWPVWTIVVHTSRPVGAPFTGGELCAGRLERLGDITR